MLEKAYAKINLFLDVTGKRRDGFHDIKSIMQTVSLCDDIDISVEAFSSPAVELLINVGEELSRIGVSSDALGDCEDNLIYRAAMLYLSRAGISAAVRVKLTKNIPISAGLAGGSADAAAILRALNKIYRAFGEGELCELAAELGSDVPFCVLGGTALCTGRGENIVRLSYTPDLNIVIAIGKEKISTPKAYAALDKAFLDFNGSVIDPGAKILENVKDGHSSISNRLRADLPGGSGRDSCIYNIFESSGLPELAEVELIKEKLRALGATATLMSGSGPSVFGIFKTKSEAEESAKTLMKEGIFAVSSQTVLY